MLVLSSPQSDKKLNRVALLEPLSCPLNTQLIVRLANIRPKLYLFHRRTRRLLLTLALLVLQFAVIHRFSYWRLPLTWLGDHDQIKVVLLRHLNSVSCIDDAMVLASMVDEQDLGGFDMAVDKRFLLLSNRTKLQAYKFCLP